MKPSRLFEVGFTVSGLLVGVAVGIWTSLAFYREHGDLLKPLATVFVLVGIILAQVVRYKFGQSNKTDEKTDA